MWVVVLNPIARKVVDLLEPHIERQGFELVAVEYRKGTNNSLLRLLVDRPDGGITLGELEKLSPALSDLLDVYDPINGRYTLEVSSPGLNRPLSKLAHFEAHRGRRVRIRTHQARHGQKSFLGEIVSVDAAGVEVNDENSCQRERIEFDEIKDAHFEYDFDA